MSGVCSPAGDLVCYDDIIIFFTYTHHCYCLYTKLPPEPCLQAPTDTQSYHIKLPRNPCSRSASPAIPVVLYLLKYCPES